MRCVYDCQSSSLAQSNEFHNVDQRSIILPLMYAKRYGPKLPTHSERTEGVTSGSGGKEETQPFSWSVYENPTFTYCSVG